MSRGLHGAVTLALSAVMVVLGLVMLVRTAASADGPAAGYLLGVLFVAVGAGRFYVERRRP